MCDYSLHLVASRPAEIGDKLVTTDFARSITRGFSAVGEPDVAVCLLPGTEIAFQDDVRYDRAFSLFGKARVRTQGRPLPSGEHGRSPRPSRRARVSGRPSRSAHPARSGAECGGVAVAGIGPREPRQGRGTCAGLNDRNGYVVTRTCCRAPAHERSAKPRYRRTSRGPGSHVHGRVEELSQNQKNRPKIKKRVCAVVMGRVVMAITGDRALHDLPRWAFAAAQDGIARDISR